jgi:hypothetical protein
MKRKVKIQSHFSPPCGGRNSFGMVLLTSFLHSTFSSGNLSHSILFFVTKTIYEGVFVGEYHRQTVELSAG